MKYLFLMYGAEDRWTDEERKDCVVESFELCDRLTAEGKCLGASPLQPVATASTVRVRDGRTLVTDGPFAETTEQLGGYILMDLADIDEAIAIASRFPTARKGVIEIRPLFTLDGLPATRPIPTGLGDLSATPYMLLCYQNEAAWEAAGPAALREAMTEATALARRLGDDGRYLLASPLHPAATATSVRVRDGKRTITDGPFAETHEVLGGFYLILADSRAAAHDIAAQHPGARYGKVEVRQLADTSALRESSLVS